MGHVALKNCELMIAFVLPHDHPLMGVEFPLYDDVVVDENHGKSEPEEIDADIADLSVANLADYLIKREQRHISWIARKPGERNHRIYVFYSTVDPALEMTPEVKDAVEKLTRMTWGYGDCYVLRNEIGLDLINIGLVKPLGQKPPRHSFEVRQGHMVTAEVGRHAGQRQAAASR